MSLYISPVGFGQSFRDDTGAAYSGGKLYTYAEGTSTPVATYKDKAGNTAHANPIVLDSDGRVPGEALWLTAGQGYKFILKTSADVTIWTVDEVFGVPEATQIENNEWISGPTPTYVSTTSFTLSGDQTSTFHAYRALKFTDASTLYGYITSSSYSSGTGLTTVNVTLVSGNLSASLTAVEYGLLSGDNFALPRALPAIVNNPTFSGNPAFSGSPTFTGTLTLNGALAGTITGTPTFSGNVTFSGDNTHSGDNTLSGVNTFTGAPARSGAAETYRYIKFQTAGVDRFAVGLANDAESGSDAGSDFIIRAANDAGSVGGTSSLRIFRDTGQVVALGKYAPSGASQTTKILGTAVFEIGVWDMDADTTKQVSITGIGGSSIIYSIAVTILSDSGVAAPLNDAGGWSLNGSTLTLTRTGSALFDSTSYDSGGSYNRGFVVVTYNYVA